jgi:AraC-like DNA-binding protein
VELVSARYGERSFPLHAHREFTLGVVAKGAEVLCVEGVRHRVPSGSALLLHPDEAHANASLGEGALVYHVIYLPADALARALGLDPGCAGDLPRFRRPVSADPRLVAALALAHRQLRHAPDALSQECAVSQLAGTLAEHGEVEDRPPPVGDERIGRVRRLLDEDVSAPLALSDLAREAGLSPFHLLRCFKQEVGLTPFAYRNQRRIEAARRLLRAGRPIAETAVEVGFTDQSHLTRQFQRLVGVSPGRYLQQ